MRVAEGLRVLTSPAPRVMSSFGVSVRELLLRRPVFLLFFSLPLEVRACFCVDIFFYVQDKFALNEVQKWL